jgi:hypothetical protein
MAVNFIVGGNMGRLDMVQVTDQLYHVMLYIFIAEGVDL